MIADNLRAVQRAMAEAAAKREAGLLDEPVRLVAVTKNHDVAAMREAIDAGVTDVGENRVQEAAEKHAILDRTVTWHLIGHLQTNKAKQAVKLFDIIHSVDSTRLALAIDKEAGKIAKVQDVLVQVNLAREETKTGADPEDMDSLLELTDRLPNLRLCGLMLIAPNYEDVEECRPLFREMRRIFTRLKEKPWLTANIKYLSMGMTHDYRLAIEEGANVVRVGTAIFGPRDYR